jgi:hypothetical protein
MLTLKDFKENNVKISWTLVLLLLDKFGDDKNLNQSIIDYAIETLLSGDNSDSVVEIASSKSTDFTLIKSEVEKLVRQEKTDFIDIEKKKFLAVYVKKNLPPENGDYMSGLIKIADIWAELDFDSTLPQIIQGVGNIYSSVEYYTEETFKEVLAVINNWIKEELLMLQIKD